MQIRHQLILLLGLPVVCQLLTVGIMNYSYGRIDELADRELKAKRAIAIGLEIRSTMEQAVLIAATKSLTGMGTSKNEGPRARIDGDYSSLKKLASKEPKTLKLLEKWQKHAYQFLDLWEELSAAFQPGENDKLFFSQFMGKGEYNESLMLAFDRVRTDTDELISIYTPIAQEFHPRAVKARADLRNGVIIAIVFNVLLVISVAIMLNKNTLSRLKILMDNMKAFSKGQSPAASLGGNDELSDLDKAFRDMSDELARLEEFRQSMRAMVNHDLRSPLTSMSLRVELMMESRNDEPVPPQMLKDLKLIKSETDRLRRLANTLLDVDKMEDGSVDVQAVNVPCADIVAVSVESLLAQCKRKKIQIVETVPADSAFFCDKDRTIQVLVNFLSNAAKFAPKNSTIEIAIVPAENDRWRLEVLDEGPGVPEDKKDKLFAKFSQLEQAAEVRKEGSGLGLYICKMLIEAQKGNVGFRGRESGGSCFWFEIPRGEKPLPLTEES